jgi:GTP pyrophosphokinase
MKIKKIIDNLKKYDKNEKSIILIEKAYEFAKEVHKDTKRASGDLFIEHPLNVAYIISKLKLDSSSIAAALLHDVVEDTNVNIDEIKKKFGDEIAMLVDGVTKLSEVKFQNKEERDYESIRKMLLATTKDIRVLIIKLADKLHNMRTLGYLTVKQQKRIAEETLEIYAPLAYRLGIASIKWELEDISFKYLKPKTYKKFKEKFGKKRIQREIEVRIIKNTIDKELKKNNIKAKIEGRPKHFYSIYKKMILKKRSFEELYDLIGLRIITDDIKKCYETLWIIHSLWKPIPNEFKDYIAMPKANMYQSLHTTVVGPKGQPIEIQIRTENMHRIAEEGIAAHWKYKGFHEDKHIDKKLNWLKQILEWQRESKNTKDFLEFLKVDFFEDEIYVFTPKGKLITLPKDSTPIDFAYSIHSSIGERCTGAIVNGRIVPLRQRLQNGDIVRILTSKEPRPKRDWLKIVKTTKAKNKIRNFLKNIENLQVNVPKDISNKDYKNNMGLIKVKNVVNPKIKFARCCNPIPWDKIIGYSTKTNRITIHKADCEDSKKIISKKKIKVEWGNDFEEDVKIKIKGVDRVGLFADILNNLAAISVNIKKAKGKVVGKNNFEILIEVTPEDLDHLKTIIDRIKRIQNVQNVLIENK